MGLFRAPSVPQLSAGAHQGRGATAHGDGVGGAGVGWGDSIVCVSTETLSQIAAFMAYNRSNLSGGSVHGWMAPQTGFGTWARSQCSPEDLVAPLVSTPSRSVFRGGKSKFPRGIGHQRRQRPRTVHWEVTRTQVVTSQDLQESHPSRIFPGFTLPRRRQHGFTSPVLDCSGEWVVTFAVDGGR